MGISNTVLSYDINSINPNQKIAGKVKVDNYELPETGWIRVKLQ